MADQLPNALALTRGAHWPSWRATQFFTRRRREQRLFCRPSPLKPAPFFLAEGALGVQWRTRPGALVMASARESARTTSRRWPLRLTMRWAADQHSKIRRGKEWDE